MMFGIESLCLLGSPNYGRHEGLVSLAGFNFDKGRLKGNQQMTQVSSFCILSELFMLVLFSVSLMNRKHIYVNPLTILHPSINSYNATFLLIPVNT